MKEIDRIGSDAFIENLARSLDPLAFRNRDKSDKAKRLKLVYARIQAALNDYSSREKDEYAQPYTIREEDIPL